MPKAHAKAKAVDHLKTAPGLVVIRLQVTPAEREAFRVLAATTRHRTMAVAARHLARAALRAGKIPEKF